LAPRLDRPEEFLLPFRHFTTAMHAGRRLPVFAAVNIDGKKVPAGAMPNRPPWSFDPRIDEAHQPDDSIFSQMLQRGHMAAREYVFWGSDAAEIEQADTHSFTLTNVCPQIQRFNATVEWFKVEREVAQGAQHEGLRVTEFVGPILRSTDPSYDDLRGSGSTAKIGTGIRIPLRFWKIVCWVEHGALKHVAFLLDQRDELQAAGPLEMTLAVPVGVTPSTVKEIEGLTDLTFAGIEG
jgi:endonuclease G